MMIIAMIARTTHADYIDNYYVRYRCNIRETKSLSFHLRKLQHLHTFLLSSSLGSGGMTSPQHLLWLD